ESAAPLSSSGVDQFVGEWVEVLCEYRIVAALLGRNMSVQAHLTDELKLPSRFERFSGIVVGPEPSEEDLLRAMSTLGAILRPIAGDSSVSVDAPEARQVIIRAARAALNS